MGKSNNVRPVRSYVIEAAAAIAFAYFLLGGSEWSPATWAIFAFVAIWIVVMHVLHDAGKMSNEAYERWRSILGILMVIGLLFIAVYRGSIWTFIIGVILGISMRGNFLRLLHSRRDTVV